MTLPATPCDPSSGWPGLSGSKAEVWSAEFEEPETLNIDSVPPQRASYTYEAFARNMLSVSESFVSGNPSEPSGSSGAGWPASDEA